MVNKPEATTKSQRKQTPKTPILVEIEIDENDGLKAIKGVLPIPSLAGVKQEKTLAEQIKTACELAADAGNSLYQGKLLMVLTYTQEPFVIMSKMTYAATTKRLKPKNSDQGN